MTLSKADIQRELGYGDLEIHRDEGDLNIEPSSVDLHLGDEIKTPLEQRRPVKVDMEATYPTYETHETPYTIDPGEFALGYAQEIIEMPDYLKGQLEGRSSVGRLGLFVENAGLVDAGFSNADLTLELFNAAPYPIELKENMRIVQMEICEHETAPSVSYSEENGNKYQGQRGPTPSRLHKDF